eukprot:297358_1
MDRVEISKICENYSGNKNVSKQCNALCNTNERIGGEVILIDAFETQWNKYANRFRKDIKMSNTLIFKDVIKRLEEMRWKIIAHTKNIIRCKILENQLCSFGKSAANESTYLVKIYFQSDFICVNIACQYIG